MAQMQWIIFSGIVLIEDCSSHGKFYVAYSKISSSSSLGILLKEEGKTNVVFKEFVKCLFFFFFN